MHILLDTNILLRSADLAHAQHQETKTAVNLLQRGNHDLYVVPQVLYEFWVVATRPMANNGLEMSVAKAAQELSSLTRFFHLLRDERTVYAFWERLVQDLQIKGKTAHDARIAAAMQRHSIGHLLTYNTSDFQRYPHVTAFSPHDVLSGAFSV